MFRVGEFHLAAGLGPFGAGLQRDLGHCGYGGQGLAAESEGEYVAEVFGGAQLGGGVALEAEHCLVGGHARAVVNHLDESPPGVPDYDGDFGGACVHRILHELFHHRRRPLDDFARGYHVRHTAGKDAYVHL